MKNAAALVVHEERTPTVLGGTSSIAEIFRLAEVLVPTGLLPEWIKSPGQAVAIMLAGRELALPPMRALRSLSLIKGRVIESADSQLARFKTDGGRAQFKTLDETKAVLWLKHPNGDEHTETFTLEDAKKAGLAGKGTWQQFPKAMLRSRVITAALKSIGWEGGAGAYDPEEAASFAPSTHEHAQDDVSLQATSFVATMSLAEAEEFAMPMGARVGHKLGDIDTHVLRAALHWTAEHDSHPEFQLALSTVLDAREKAEKGGGVAVSDSPVQTTERTLATAPSAPASPDDDRTRWSAAKLQKHVLDLLTHPSLNKQLVATYRDQINAGLTKVQLVQISYILDEKIMAPSA